MSHPDSAYFVISFPKESHHISQHAGANARMLREYTAFLDSLQTDPKLKVTAIEIRTGAAPNASDKDNIILTRRRSNSLIEYTKRYLKIDESQFLVENIGTNWQGLNDMLYDAKIVEKYVVLAILNDSTEMFKKGRLQKLYSGRTWEKMEKEIFPRLDRSYITIRYTTSHPRDDSEYIVESSVVAHRTNIKEYLAQLDTVNIRSNINYTTGEFPFDWSDLTVRTNLLYCAALVPNVSFTLDLSYHITAGIGIMGSWWGRPGSGKVWRSYGIELKAMYYLEGIKRHKGNGTVSSHIGKHIGLYLNSFTYDFCLDKKGQVGRKPQLAVGLEYGYTYPIWDRVSVDFVVGAGFLRGNHETYSVLDGYDVWDKTVKRRWIGPTKAEVSLIIELGNKKDKIISNLHL